MKTRIYNLIILDASESMCSIKKQAVDGVNGTVQTIREAQSKHEDQEHYVTLVFFNSSAIVKIYDCEAVVGLEELTGEEYDPDGSTPLYDAMGYSITELQNKLEKDDKVLVTVITDGYENASYKYDEMAIAALVDKLQNEGWVFTYIGANQNVEKVAAGIHIHNRISFETTCTGTSAMFAKEKKARSRFFDRLAAANNCGLFEDYFDDDK